MAESDNLAQVLGSILEPLPEAKRLLMVSWATQEMESRPLITRCTKRIWADAYKDNAGTVHPGEWQSLQWCVGQASPSHSDAIIFAMLLDEGLGGQGPAAKVAVYSFGRVKDDKSGEEGIVYFKELVFAPDLVYGPATGEAIYRDFFDFFATEEQRESAMAEGARAEHANGAPS